MEDVLTEKERKVVELRIRGLTLEQIGKMYNCTRERIRQIEWKAKLKLRHHRNESFNILGEEK